MNEIILKYLIAGIITIISSIITSVLLPAISTWIQSKIQNERMQSYVQDITMTVATTVNCLEQTMVAQYKNDGNWNKETQQKVLDAAVKQVMDSVTMQTKKLIEDQCIDMQALVTRYIESYIIQQKTQ